MAESRDSSMMEGFLCPICKGDFGAAIKLLSHFQEEHSEEQDLLKSFKELFGKAKKKILKQGEEIEYYSNQVSPTRYDKFAWEEQEIGSVRSHFEYFDEIRRARLQRFSTPVNQLLIRLDKLLDDMPRDPTRKKVHEQNVVPWLDGSAVPRCPSCARSFHLTRRQHHCRLCGAVLCHDCSHFLPLQTAYKLLEKPGPKIDDMNEAAPTLRICQICLNLLESRQQQKESVGSKRIITQFYERLCDYRRQADEDFDMYIKMHTSLSEGDSTYNLPDAQALREKIIRLAETIQNLSEKIAVLGSKDTENPPQGQALVLQKAIKTATTAFLRTKVLTLPPLPTEDELNAIRENKRLLILARLQEENLTQAQLNQQTFPNQKKATAEDGLNSEKGFSVGHGWVPSEQMMHFRSDDPLIQQINIIQNYIKEARTAHRYDEVVSLEDNLKELKQEYWRQQEYEK